MRANESEIYLLDTRAIRCAHDKERRLWVSVRVRIHSHA